MTGTRHRLGLAFIPVFFALICATHLVHAQGINIVFQSLSWRPDGKAAAFTAIKVKQDWSDYAPNKWRLFLYDLGTGKLAQLDSGTSYLSFSPDGNKILYDKGNGEESNILMIDLKTKSISTVAGYEINGRGPNWSADGKSFVFYSDHSRSEQLYTGQVGSDVVRKLTGTVGQSCFNPMWAPDSDLIVYYVEVGDHKDQIYLTDETGSFHTNLTHNEHHNTYPSWTPDGRIIYTQDGTQVMTMGPNGENVKQLCEAPLSQVRMSPDGISLLIGHSGQGTLSLYQLQDNSEKILLKGDQIFK